LARKQHDWPEAARLCKLDQHDIAMAKRLGFSPATLIRARPDPKQRWKLPVREWIHELHLKRFGSVEGEKPAPRPRVVAINEFRPKRDSARDSTGWFVEDNVPI
jgi:hypothetical protein